MIVETFFDEGLGNSSYVVAPDKGNSVVVIDPQRDVDRYLAAADRHRWRITHALETHLHADFVSGSRELEARVGATVVASADARLASSYRAVRDDEIFEAAGLRFRALATPGHTPEHLSYLLLSDADAPEALFSGGALLVGSAARTDLIGPEWTDRLTRALYHSLHDHILRLPDELPVLPTHGAGSFCATGTRRKGSTTIGEERRTNPLLAAPTEDAFALRALQDLPAYPDYFLRMRPLNQAGPAVLGGLPIPPELSAEAAHRALEEGAVVIDARSAEAFDAAHIPGAFGIPLSAAFASWVGWVVPPEKTLILLTDTAEDTEEAVRQLIRIGYDGFKGSIRGLDAWRAAYPTVEIERVSVQEVSLADPNLPILDVREESEWRQGHIPGALSVPLSELRRRLEQLPRHAPLLVHCGHEFRSTIADSLLERADFHVRHLGGGFEAWQRAGKPIEIQAAAVPAV